MSEAVTLAYIGAIVTLVTLMVNTLLTYLTHRRTVVADKKLDEIHEVGNSTLSATKARNAELEKVIETLLDEKVVASEQRAAVADQKVIVAEQKAVIAEQKAVVTDQKVVLAEQNGMISDQKKQP